jgi:hypothetical protein
VQTTKSVSKFARPASAQSIEKTAAALVANNFGVIVVQNGAEARQRVLELVPEGAEVHSGKSKTLDDLGLSADLHESSRFDSVRERYLKMDRKTQEREIRKLTSAPDYFVGSAHALTEGGQLVTASYSGSQVGPYASGAGKVILVIGSQKLVPNLDQAMQRLREYAIPYEDARLREAMGIGTKPAKILIHSAEGRPGRTTVIIVREPVGV